MIIRENFSLRDVTTLHLDVRCDRFVEYETVDELRQLLTGELRGKQFLHIGGGSNLVFSGHFNGYILHSLMRKIAVVREDEQSVWVEAESGHVWDDFVRFCVEHGYYGAENMSNIPGECGASAVQNVGSYGAEAKDIIHEVKAISTADGAERVFSCQDCRFAYRDSIFKNELKGKYIITSVIYRLGKTPRFNLSYGALQHLNPNTITLQGVRDAIIGIRASKLPDPAVTGSVGSFFKNPIIARERYEALLRQFPDMPKYDIDTDTVKVPAGWLIEHCDLKGHRIGGAYVYEKQCLVLANSGTATCHDMVALSRHVIASVAAKFSITLSPEANIIEC